MRWRTLRCGTPSTVVGGGLKCAGWLRQERSMIYGELKWCNKCRQELPFSLFTKDRAKADGLQTVCKFCGNRQKAEYRKAHPEVRRQLNQRYRLRHAHNMSMAVFNRHLESQGYKCKLCQTSFEGASTVVCVDHDHSCCPAKTRSCGRCFRGLLCRNCNTGLGHFKDNVKVLMKAITYLQMQGEVCA